MKNVTKENNRGITLIALIITIIVLLILAGITVAQLSNNGLFESAKLAKEKWKKSEDNENSILEEYDSNIDYYTRNNNSELLSKIEELETQIKIARPDLWQANVEQSFGDGLYGTRFTGNYTISSSSSTVNIVLGSNISYILNKGGGYTLGGDWITVGSLGNTSASWGDCAFKNANNKINFRVMWLGAPAAGSNEVYDVWFLYQKV